MKHIRESSGPSQIRLSLQEAIRRALLHSYAIRVAAYNPAIQATRVVQAEARFDATFFFNYQDELTDHPIAPQSVTGLQALSSLLSGSGTSSRLEQRGFLPAGIVADLLARWHGDPALDVPRGAAQDPGQRRRSRRGLSPRGRTATRRSVR